MDSVWALSYLTDCGNNHIQVGSFASLILREKEEMSDKISPGKISGDKISLDKEFHIVFDGILDDSKKRSIYSFACFILII